MAKKKPSSRKKAQALNASLAPAPERVSSSLEPAPLTPGSRFLLEKSLGSGGICEVFAALDLLRVQWSDARPQVAIKRLRPHVQESPQARLSLVQEFCTLRHVIHPGVVRVFDLHEEATSLCFSMELLEGKDLTALLPGRAPASPAAAQSGTGPRTGSDERLPAIAARLLDTLTYLHQHGIVHADIKPSNIFLEPGGRVVLIDFNMATVIVAPGAASRPATSRLKQAARVKGHSLLYASPEQLDEYPPTPASDVFSACCTLYELFAGQHPFLGKTAQEARALNVQPHRPPGLNRQQWNLLCQGLAYTPEARPAASQLFSVFRPKGGMLESLRHLSLHF